MIIETASLSMFEGNGLEKQERGKPSGQRRQRRRFVRGQTRSRLEKKECGWRMALCASVYATGLLGEVRRARDRLK